MVIENGMLGGIETGGGHLLGGGETDGIGDALSEGAGGGLDAGCLAELRVAGGAAFERPEVLDGVEGDVVAGEVQPRVEEHRAVAGGEDEAVAVDPAGHVGVEME